MIGLAFREVGFSAGTTALLLAATLLGSFVNLPLLKVKSRIPLVRTRFVDVFGIVYRIPEVQYGESTTQVAVNLGGAIIPTAISLYLLWRMPSAVPSALIGVAVVAGVTHLVARPVRGMGIATPAIVPPVTAALVAYLLPFRLPQITAYVSGVMGALIGADLLNLYKVPRLGARYASIGGAGTFDGIFLSGIISVLLV